MARGRVQGKCGNGLLGKLTMPKGNVKCAACCFFFGTLLIASGSIASWVDTDSQAPVQPEDETCLMQVKQTVLKSAERAELATKAAVADQAQETGHFASGGPMWDYEMDAGGLTNPAAVPKCGKGTPFLCGAPPPPKYPPHPLWQPEWKRMLSGGAIRAGLCLWAAGVICCAGGIGGGGIYVTVLMVFGNLSVHDAIPLSKVVVFAASAPSLVLNLLKNISLKELGEAKEGPEAEETKSLIDWNLCRIVVPFALIGTLMGVFLNNIIPGKVVIGLLCCVLIGITIMVCRTGYGQHCAEKEAEAKAAQEADDADGKDAAAMAKKLAPPGPPGGGPSGMSDVSTDEGDGLDDITQLSCDGNGPGGVEQAVKPKAKNCPDASKLPNVEVALACSMLLVIILCGVFHFWAESCANFDWVGEKPCHNPIAQIISFGQIIPMKRAGILAGMGVGAMVLAIVYCTIIGCICVHRIMSTGQVYGSFHNFDSLGNDYDRAVMGGYVGMSLMTGALAGLVGIGGGLIFSPVFICMKVDTHIAVATSATCVIFTSCSTTFQYLFSDRIIVALVFSFCIPHLFAAYTGTKLVHYIQDNYGTKKSWITWIVAIGVAISCILAIDKFFSNQKVAD